jgi:hypothetical protein
MNNIRQHIPAFVSGVNAETASFETIADLLKVPFVAQWTGEPEFRQFSISARDYLDDWVLMAELNGGAQWWVVGYLDQNVDLPIWDEEEAQRLRKEVGIE